MPRVRPVVRHVVAIVVAAMGSACASGAVDPTPAVPQPPPPSIDTKVAWILRLEQQRVLRDPDVSASSVPTGAPSLVPARTPDLAALITDTDESIRARAALAIGRTGVEAGRPVLESALQDPDEDVRASAAFGLGLLGSRTSTDVLHASLDDPSLLVRARVIEALGLIGDSESAPWVSRAAAGCADLMAPIEPDDEEWPKAPEIEVCRLSLYALVRMGRFDALAQVALNEQGRPVSNWWPVAYALQRSGDRGALTALRHLSTVPGVFTAGFALRGLAALGDREALPVARALVSNREADVKLRVAAIRVLAQLGTNEDLPRLIDILSQEPSSSHLAVEAVAAIGERRAPEAFDVLLDGFSDRSPVMRAVSLAAAAKVNPDAFLVVLSSLGRDSDWSVRAALATVLGTLSAEHVTAALVDLSADEDPRVHGAALRALAAVKVPDLAERLAIALKADDFAARAIAAELVGQFKPAGGAAWLADAYELGEIDTAYSARLAAVEAIASYGGEQAAAILKRALDDREWPVRVRAAQLLGESGVPDVEPSRPAPLRWPETFFESDELLRPRYSPRAFVETRQGVIELQLDVMHAPLTSAAFIEQARSGFFTGMRAHRVVPAFVVQVGDPRGDGWGGPGYTLRDEFSWTPYLRGTVGMALAGPETGGSQWFIVTSPQPHLDGKYTAFGRVVSGWDVIDRLTAVDRIERVRIWDGFELR